MSDDDRVITLDDYRRAVRPMTVVFGGRELKVVESVSLFVSAGVDYDSPVRRGFRVRCEGGARFELVLTEGVGWEITPIPGPRLVE